jgi:hypothetical protein
MSRAPALVTVVSSYQEYQVPPVRVQVPVTVGAVTASSRRTSARVLQPSWSASIHPPKLASRL